MSYVRILIETENNNKNEIGYVLRNGETMNTKVVLLQNGKEETFRIDQIGKRIPTSKILIVLNF